MSEPFISYAQNREDVVLHRALGHISNGRYVEIGANDPVDDSVTYAFYQRGWSGLAVEPVPEYARRLRETRPRDRVVEAAVSDTPSQTVTLHVIADSGLSTVMDAIGDQHRDAGLQVVDVEVPAVRLDRLLEEAGWAGQDIHFMLVDTEGSERSVLASVDLSRWRPWVLVVEATRPNSTEPTHEEWEDLVVDRGYRFCFFDGLSRFYVAAEQWDALHSALAAPANVLDRYRTHVDIATDQEKERLRQDGRQAREMLDDHAASIVAWRAAALRAVARQVSQPRRQELDQLLHQNHLNVNHISMVDAELERVRAEVAHLHEVNGALDRGLREAAAERDALRTEAAALRQTVSWRVTAPLRALRSVGRRRTRG